MEPPAADQESLTISEIISDNETSFPCLVIKQLAPSTQGAGTFPHLLCLLNHLFSKKLCWPESCGSDTHFHDIAV